MLPKTSAIFSVWLYVLSKEVLSKGSTKTVFFVVFDCSDGKFNNLSFPYSLCVCSSAS